MEPFISLFLALGVGLTILHDRIEITLCDLEKNIGGIELKIVEELVIEHDFKNTLVRMQTNMVRVEQKTMTNGEKIAYNNLVE